MGKCKGALFEYLELISIPVALLGSSWVKIEYISASLKTSESISRKCSHDCDAAEGGIKLNENIIKKIGSRSVTAYWVGFKVDSRRNCSRLCKTSYVAIHG